MRFSFLKKGEFMQSELILKAWSLHPSASKIQKANFQLNGHANQDALKFCGPYKFANQIGFWLYSPVDIDITWKGGREFEHTIHGSYDNSDYKIINDLIKDDDPISKNGVWISPQEGRTKFTFGSVEDGVVQIWTGLILKTQPNWCLQISSCINFPDRGFEVMNGVLDTDWMFYDIWVNLVFKNKDQCVKIRKNDSIPLAQLVPIPRETYNSDWIVEQQPINRQDEESKNIFEYWLGYNQKKFNCGGKQFLTTGGDYKKTSSTFFSERQSALCPHLKKKSRKVCYIISDNQKYFHMLYVSIKMLREFNNKIPIEVIFLSDCIDLPEELKSIRDLYSVDFSLRVNKNDEYFFYNREYISEVECESLLYLDSDTFINFDVEILFEKYHQDFVGSENYWMHSYGWSKDFVERVQSPYNGGVLLTNKSKHKILFKEYISVIKQIEAKTLPVHEWCMGVQNGYNKEEVAITLYLDKTEWVNGYFENRDVYNVRNIEDIQRIQDYGIFHAYGNVWEKGLKHLQGKIKNRFIPNKSFVK